MNFIYSSVRSTKILKFNIVERNKWKVIPWSCIGTFNVNVIFRFSTLTVKFQADFFFPLGIDKHPEIHVEMQKAQNSHLKAPYLIWYTW